MYNKFARLNSQNRNNPQVNVKNKVNMIQRLYNQYIVATFFTEEL